MAVKKGGSIPDAGGCRWRTWLPLALGILLAATLAASAPTTRHSLPPLTAESGTFLIHHDPPAINNLTVHNWSSVVFNYTQIAPATFSPQLHASSFADRVSHTNNSVAPNATKSDNGYLNEGTGSATAVHFFNESITATTFVNSRSGAVTRGVITRGGVSVSQGIRETTTLPWGPKSQTTQQERTTATPEQRYVVVIYSSNDLIAKPALWGSENFDDSCTSEHNAKPWTGKDEGGEAQTAEVSAENPGSESPPPLRQWWRWQGRCYVLMDVVEGQQHNFTIHGLHVGRVTMSISLVDKASALLANNGVLDPSLAHDNGALATAHIPVETVRGERTADCVFDSSAAAIAILITFGIGCCTDTDSVKKQLKFPVSLIIGFCCQFILMPVLAFGLAMILPVKKDICFGLLCTACVPGGGLGHIAVIIGDADIPLSLTMNLISNVAMLGTAPLWIFVLGQYFQSDSNAIMSPRIIPIYNFEIWLASIFLAYATGLVVNRFRPVVADMLLTWVIKPFLLLATILYITVGVYINMYVFEIIDNYAVLGAILLPLIGCLLGFTLAAVCRQKFSFVKTIALETSSLNCLIVLAALRFSLKQPDADLASMVPIWVMFTIPGLYVVLALLQRFYNTAMYHWNNRNRSSANSIDSDGKISPGAKDYDVASGIMSRPGLAALSAPLVVADGADDDPTNNEKVTVL